MSSQSNPNPEPSRLENIIDSAQDPEEGQTLAQHRRGVAREKAHDRAIGLAHHKGQAQEVHGGRSAARHQAETDPTRSRGRAKPRLERGGMGAAPEGSLQAEDRVTTAGPPGKGTSEYVKEILGQEPGSSADLFVGSGREAAARKRDPVPRPEGLPPDHPEVLKEIKFDRMSRLMQPGGTDDLVDQELGLDDNDDWIY